MKVLIAGPDSIHVNSYINSLKGKVEELFYLGESPVDFWPVSQQFALSFRSSNPLDLMKSNVKLKRLLKDLQPDIVHVHQLNRLAYFVTRMCGKLNIPCVSTAWGSDVLLIPQKNFFYKKLIAQSIERSRFITADSLDMIRAIKGIAEVEDDRIVHLQYGIDFMPAAPKEKLIYSNRLHESNYRIDQIIRYFEDFHKLHPDWKLVIAGAGSLTGELESLSANFGLGDSVEFVGWLSPDKNKAWCAKSAIFISIPRSDGTSVSLLEAIASQCVPVVSDLEVSKEWLRSGENGIIEKESENPLLSAMALLGSATLEMNAQKIRSSFSRERSVGEFLKLYLTCTKTK